MPFRPEDQALLERLEDEAVYEQLLASHVGPHVAAPRRAAGLVAELRSLPGGDKAFAMANAEDPQKRRLDALGTLMMPVSFAGYPPALLHHLALHFGRVARLLEATDRVRALYAHETSLAAFFSLAGHERYMHGFVSTALGEKAKPGDVARLAGSLPLEPLLALGERAMAGARSLAPGARAALDALARVPVAAERSGAPPAIVTRVTSKADALRADAVDAALEPVSQALDDATLANELTTRGIAALHGIVPVWEFSGRDEAVERFFVERAEPVCWEIQRRKEWDRFATLFGTASELPGVRELAAPKATFRLVESLIARVKADRGKVAYAAACAQFLVFYTNVVSTLDRQIAVGERAIDVCPSHRNGRAVLASFLSQKALRVSDGMVPTRASLEEAWTLVERATVLFPSSREVQESRDIVERRRNGGLPRIS